MRRTLFIMLSAAAATAVVLSVRGTTLQAKANDATKAPAACVASISAARRGFQVASRALTTVQPLFTMVGEAAQAGARGDAATINSIATRLKKMSAQLDALNGELVPLAVRFNANAAKCR